MIDRKDLKAGVVIFYENMYATRAEDRLKKVTIKSVGRKYIHTECNYKIEIHIVLERYFLTKADYEYEVCRRSGQERLVRRISGDIYLAFEQIIDINKIIGNLK